jgi:protein phosphatase
MRIRVGAATDIGQVREGNEDSFLVQDPLFAVADGMGGHRGGEVASTLALATIRRLLAAREGSLGDRVQEANRAVFERSQADREVAGMGTTLTAAELDGGRLRLAHVGDSRAYLFRDGRLRLLTEDHTLVHRMVLEGEITESEAESHPHRSILTRALGVDGAVEVDEDSLELHAGDRLLLCTDGLTGMVADEDIETTLGEVPDPQEAVERLVGAANRAGGVDNITAVILDVTEDGAAADETTGAAGAETRTRTTTEPDPFGTASRPISPAPAGTRRDGATETRGAARRPPAGRPRSRSGRGFLRVGIGVGVSIAVLLLGLVGLRLFLDSQWFVGVSNGRVAIFRGVPTEVVGLKLHAVVVETTIPAAEAEELALYRDLSEGITAENREAADAIVEAIREDLAAVQPAGP